MDTNFARIARNLPQPKFQKTFCETLAQGNRWLGLLHDTTYREINSAPPRPQGFIHEYMQSDGKLEPFREEGGMAGSWLSRLSGTHTRQQTPPREKWRPSVGRTARRRTLSVFLHMRNVPKSNHFKS